MHPVCRCTHNMKIPQKKLHFRTPNHSRYAPFLCAFFVMLGTAGDIRSEDGNWSGELRTEYRYFPHPAAPSSSLARQVKPIGATGQSDPTAALQIGYTGTLESGVDFAFKGFLRYDHMDSARTHADIREMVWKTRLQTENDPWDLRIGIDKVFWGVAESNHLVNVINQTDLVENIDEMEKLGQPMLRMTASRNWGSLDIFLLPYFRERTFAGRNGRLRPAIPRTETPVRYGTKLAEFMPDMALRWSRNFSRGDLGVYYFQGTNREPRISQDSSVATVRNPLGLVQNYDRMRQIGLDGNLLLGDWILKGETIIRHTHHEKFHASVAGVEYTISGLLGTPWDLNLFVERSLDSRGAKALLQNDNFIGARISLNDLQSTQVKIGQMRDQSDGSRSIRLEAVRRLANNMTLRLEGQHFRKIAATNLLNVIKADSYTQISLIYYF